MSPAQASTAKKTAKAEAGAKPAKSEPPQAKARGYLVYEIPGLYGIGHVHGNLDMQLLEACLLNRIPVTEARAHLTPMHSRKSGRWSDQNFFWGDYVRLDQTQVAAEGRNGADPEYIPWPFLVVEDMKDWLGQQKDVREIHGDEKASRDNPEEVLFRRNTSSIGRTLFGFYSNHLRPQYEADPNVPKLLHTRFPPATEIAQVAAKAVDWLGDEFWGLHLRRGDWLGLQPAQYLYCTDAPQVAETLQKAGATPDTRVFLMTDASSPKFVEPLRQACNLAWERECEPLMELGRESQDNYQVYWAGMCAMAHAKRRFSGRGLAHGLQHADRLPPATLEIPATAPMPAAPGKDEIYVSPLVDDGARVPLGYWLHWLLLRHVVRNFWRGVAKIRREWKRWAQ